MSYFNRNYILIIFNKTKWNNKKSLFHAHANATLHFFNWSDLFFLFICKEFIANSCTNNCQKLSINLIHIKFYRFNVRLFSRIEVFINEHTVHVLFRNSHCTNDFNFNVNELVRVEVEVYVDFATSLLCIFLHWIQQHSKEKHCYIAPISV